MTRSDLLPRRRLWFLRLLTIVIALSASLFFVELILHIQAWYQAAHGLSSAERHSEVYEFSATRHHRLVANARYRHKELEFDYLWSNNSLGMRDRERSLPKASGSFRVLFLGDSMVQGYGVPQEQTMITLLEASLNNPKLQKVVEVLNGGVFGYSPLLEYLYLREIMPVVEPDVVLVGFFLGNDVGDDYFYTQQARVSNLDGSVSFAEEKWPWDYNNEVLKANGESVAGDSGAHGANPPGTGHELLFAGYVKALALKSHLVRMVLKMYDQRRKSAEYRRHKQQEAQLVRERVEDIRVNLGLVNYPVTTREQRMKYWEVSKAYLADMYHLCQKQTVTMILVVIPVLEPEVNRFAEPYEVLDEFGRGLSIPVIQLLPDLRTRAPGRLVFALDGHWNAEGNRFAAAILDRELRGLNVLPPVRTP